MPTPTPPLYDIGDFLYLRESAALGFLEVVKVSGLMLSKQGWVYAIEAKIGLPQAQTVMGDRISAVHGNILYFSEGEFVVQCDAMDLVQANLEAQLARIVAQRASVCADITG